MKFTDARAVFVVSLLVILASSFAGGPTMAENTEYKKPTKEELKKRLTPEQYLCTVEADTEKPFLNTYWNNKADGIYVDVTNGEPLFSSLDKYDSGSGWPSFTKPLEDKHLSFKSDFLIGAERTEVRSKIADAHLGHVFDDGPKDKGGKRYCMNSASLEFIGVDKMKERGYGRFLFLFADKQHWEVATLAGGCFWGVEDLLRKEKGVIETQVGYTGGNLKNAIYEEVKKGKTHHAETVQVLFDPKVTSYENMLLYFFKLHDPTTANQQGNDKGTQYRSAIFYSTDKQKEIAEKVKARVGKSGQWKKPVVTEIIKAQEFWRAEEYHQKYLKKDPGGYTCHFVRDLAF